MKHIETLIQELKKKTKYELDEQEHEQAVSALIARLYDPRVEFRKEAVELLAKLGDPQAIEPLADAIPFSIPSTREAFTNAIRQFIIAHPDAVLQLPPHKRQRVERERHTALHQELEKALCQNNRSKRHPTRRK